MEKVKLLLSCVLVGVLVALTYFVFETAVHHSISYVWDTLFDTETKRFLVIPLSLAGAFIFFGLQHLLDPKSEHHESHGLGGAAADASLSKLAIILFIGYFSLLGGASLGPEAILVPSSMVIGTYVGKQLFRTNDKAHKALMAAGIMALFTAFFHSWIVGLLSMLLVKKQAKTSITPQLVIISLLASGASYFTLKIIDPTNSYFNMPDFTWRVLAVDIVAGIILICAGYMSTFALKFLHDQIEVLHIKAQKHGWLILSLIAGLGIGALYLLGGPLIEFTGNESIEPLFSQASSLGVASVILILITKLIAIGWSKSMGYRGGLIFPMVFVASTLVVIVQFVFHDINIGIGIIAALIGILAAEKKAKILL